jgi:Glycosyltransferase family 87
VALLWHRPRPVIAGLVLGVAAATKATAWPTLIVVATMLTVRDGWRTAGRFLVAALATACAIIGPVAVLWEHPLVENTILFPLGLASVKSQAVSPLPGHVLADTGHAGHLIAVSLLCLAGLGVLVSLVVRPPRNVPSATWRLIIGLVLMFVLAPATRFGYFMYPLGLWVWLAVSQQGAQRGQPAGARMHEHTDGPGPPSGELTQPSPA